MTTSWIRRLFSSRKPVRKPCRTALAMEALEDRRVPALFTVTSLLDGGPGSLRQAILDAAANHEADIIGFAPALAGKTLTLTQDDANHAFGPTALVIAS